jgi:hypothetical protein
VDGSLVVRHNNASVEQQKSRSQGLDHWWHSLFRCLALDGIVHSRMLRDCLQSRQNTSQPVAGGYESPTDFDARLNAAAFLKGDRTDPVALKKLIDPDAYAYVYDMNAREVSGLEPLASLFVGSKNLKQYVLISAGVYLKSQVGTVFAIPQHSLAFHLPLLHLWIRQLQSR